MHFHRRPEVFSRSVYAAVSVLTTFVPMAWLAHVDAREWLHRVTGLPAFVLGAALILASILATAAWWGVMYVVARKANMGYSSRPIVVLEFAIVVITAAMMAVLLRAAGLHAWLGEMTGWAPLAIKLPLGFLAVLVTLLAWRGVLRVVSWGKTGREYEAAPVLEFAIVVFTALSFTLLLHDIIGESWWASALIGVGGSIVVWVPWLHLWPGEGHRPIPSRDTSSRSA